MMKYVSVLLLSTFLFGCASGAHVVTGKSRPEIEESQVFFFETAPVFSYEVIGIVKASSDKGFSEEARKEKAIKELKNQAAKIGANGVILEEVTQLSFRGLGSSIGLGIGSRSGVRTSFGSSFSFPTAEAIGTAIYYQPNLVD